MSKTVLVVEDEPFVREMTVEFLEDAEMVVHQAATADQALDILLDRASEFCLLFTDVQMPGKLDGLDLARVVLKRWPHIAIVVTSGAFRNTSDVLPPGADFIAKPWLPLDMVAKLERAKQRPRHRRNSSEKLSSSCSLPSMLSRGTSLTGPAGNTLSHKSDTHFMREALHAATDRGHDPALNPIGSIIVRDGHRIAVARNHVDDFHDATAHAEMVAIRRAGKAFQAGELRGAILYTTLQPCGMCTMAAIWSKVGRIVYGAGREDVHQMYFEARHVETLDFVANSYRKDLSIEGGVLREECARLYYGPNDNPPAEQQGSL